MKTVSVVIPVHELNDSTKELLGKALISVAEQKVLPNEVLLVHPKEVSVDGLIPEKISSITKEVINDGETDFATQLNKGVAEASSEFVCFLEMDDLLSKIWIDNFQQYTEEYDDVSLFMPIVAEVDADGKFSGLNNQLTWSQGFNEIVPMGYLDNSALLDYPNFNFAGMVVKKDSYLNVGGLKPSIKLVFMYEFLLRYTFNNEKILVVPKIAYQHVNFREGSIFDSYKDTIDPVENNWWIAHAKKEYYFNNDRGITYEG